VSRPVGVAGSCALALLTAGCAGQLNVYDANGAEVKGMPFRTAEIFVKQGTYAKSTTVGDACTPAPFQQIVSVATGPQYFVKATTAQFAKTAFHIKYNDAGGVAEVGLESEPAAAETIKATTEAVKAAASLIGIGTVAAVARAPGKPACDTGETDVSYQSFEAYRLKHPGP
jgi:hypothetical protein